MTRRAGAPAPGEIAGWFPIPTPIDQVRPLGAGLINDTFAVTARGGGWVLQRINGRVFPHPERIMENLAVLSAHLGSTGTTDLRIPLPIATADGRPFVTDQGGNIWRLTELIPDARVLPRVETASQAREVGRALGRFHRLTADLDPQRLSVTLPGFHVTPRYLERFTRALRQGNGACHAGDVRRAVALVAARRDAVDVLEDARRRGLARIRIVHGDPKLDNLLFDASGTRVVGLIDLDTLQPGLLHHDIGDCLRSCCNRLGESPDAETRACFDLGICREILDAYGAETRGLLNAAEVALVYEAVRLVPFELGLRFLTDHLEGDRYFRVTAPGQNLRKALVQFALVEDIEEKEGEIRRIVAECFGPVGAAG